MHIGRDEVKLVIETAEMRIAASVARIEECNRAIKKDMSRARVEMVEFRSEVRADFKNLRRTIVVTGISAVLAVLFGVCAVNSALLTHLTSGVEFGSRAAAEHEALREQIRRVAADLPRPPPAPAAALKK